jgi:serine/threonine protein kinase
MLSCHSVSLMLAGSDADIVFSLRYAAPELIMAMEAGNHTIKACAAVDVWALGVIAFELLTGVRTFPVSVTKREVCDCLMGRKPLPWEEGSPGAAERVRQMGNLQRSVLSCLERDKKLRPTAREVLASWNYLLEHTTVTASRLLD